MRRSAICIYLIGALCVCMVRSSLQTSLKNFPSSRHLALKSRGTGGCIAHDSLLVLNSASNGDNNENLSELNSRSERLRKEAQILREQAYELQVKNNSTESNIEITTNIRVSNDKLEDNRGLFVAKAPIVNDEINIAKSEGKFESKNAEYKDILVDRQIDKKARTKLLKQITGNVDVVASAQNNSVGTLEKVKSADAIYTYNPTIEKLQSAYNNMPRWLLAPMAAFFLQDENITSGEDKLLFELAFALTIKELFFNSEDNQNEINIDISDIDSKLVREKIRILYLSFRSDEEKSFSLSSVSSCDTDNSQAEILSKADFEIEKSILLSENRLLLNGMENNSTDKKNLLTQFLKRNAIFLSNLRRGSSYVGLSSLQNEAEKELDLERGYIDQIVDKQTDENGSIKKIQGDGGFESIIKTIEESITSDENALNTSAERLINTYFDAPSRINGMAIGRQGSGRFQNECLSGIFTVQGIKNAQGAVIFDGVPVIKDRTEFAKALEEKYISSDMKNEVGYTIILNEKIPDFDDGFERAALDVLLGTAPAVIVYPLSWNSTISSSIQDPAVKIWRSFLSSASILSSALFSANCVNLFDPDGQFMTNGIMPDTFLPLALTPILIQMVSSLIETIVAKSKGFVAETITLPTLTTFHFGSRSTYTTMPKNRSDMFDTAAIGISSALSISIALMVYGIVLTSQADSDTINNFPTISLSLLSVNSVIGSIFSERFPNIFSDLNTFSDTTVHMHWLAIAGALTFVANSLQLLPLDNSAGSKMSYALLGKDNFDIITIFAGLAKFAFIVPMLFNVGDSNAIATATIISTPRLFLDYILSSQIATSNESQISVDNLSELSESRKIVFLAFFSLLIASFFPFGSIGTNFDPLVNSFSNFFTP